MSGNVVSLDSICFLWHSIVKHDSRVFSGVDLIMNKKLKNSKIINIKKIMNSFESIQGKEFLNDESLIFKLQTEGIVY